MTDEGRKEKEGRMATGHILVFSQNAAIAREMASGLPDHVSAAYHTDLSDFKADLGDAVNLLVFVLPPDGELKPASLALELRARPFVLVVPDGVSIPRLNTWIPFHPHALIPYPFEPETLRSALSEAIGSQEEREHQTGDSLAAANRRLNQRLQEINLLYTIGKSMTSLLEVNEVLERVVEASVNLTQADEGFILLREDAQLFVRVAKHHDEAFPRQIHQRISDPIAWQVIRSGRPAMLDRETKIGTGLLVRSLLYVPLQAPGRGMIGVLGVVNHIKGDAFTEAQLFTLSAVADFAAIAFENARHFSAMESERSRLSAVLEHAAEAIIVTDTANRLWLWSDAAADHFSLGPEAEGEPLKEIIEHQALVDLFYGQNGGDRNRYIEVELAGGQIFNAQLSTIGHVGHVVVMQEITHLKELDRLRSQFVSTVSHDLRTPLTTIQGYVALLERVGPLNEMQKGFIQKAMDSLDYITDLITDLLDIGRIEAGYDLDMGAIRLDEIVRHTAEDTQIEAQDHELDLWADVPEAPLWVWGNRRRLQQVLDNLVSNAIKYNEPGGWISLKAERDGDHILISVSDNGIGISKEDQHKIFERFFRVQSPETEEIRGTGLGLAIVKSVVEKHKGRIWVESARGEGSTFSFLLPVHQPEMPPTADRPDGTGSDPAEVPC